MMKNLTLRLLTCFAVLALMLGPSVAKADVIVGNAGFETAGGGGATDSDLWVEAFGGAAGTTSERDGTNPFEGNNAHFLSAVGDVGVGGSAVVIQNSIADAGFPSLVAGTDVNASFQWDGNIGVGGVGSANLRILDSEGAIVANTSIALNSTVGYQLQSFPTLTVPDTGSSAYASFLEIVVQAGAFDGSFAQGYVDAVDIQGTVVPEPTTASLLGLACIGMLARRRR